MPPPSVPPPAAGVATTTAGTKRKNPPSSSTSSSHAGSSQHTANNQPNRTPGSHTGLTRQQTHAQARKRQRTNDARYIASQTTAQAYHAPSAATSGPSKGQTAPAKPIADAGQIAVDRFVRAREFEIRALESGLRRAGAGLNSRAFQGVPKELRRRTASHDVRRVPKRLKARARREMLDDNTPAPVKRRAAKRRERKAQAWVRAGTRDVITRLFGSKKKGKKQKDNVETKGDETKESTEQDEVQMKGASVRAITAREKRQRRKAVKSGLQAAPVLIAKFRKRQVNKAWLPTHVYHAKRAHMTPPSEPLWRMAIPLSPTVKSYRPTHRASSARGAVAWDVSYMSTIGLSGPEEGVLRLLKLVGVELTGAKAKKWLSGTRSWTAWTHQEVHELHPKVYIAPATVFWNARERNEAEVDTKNVRRQAMLRVHPSAFMQLWTELLRLSKTPLAVAVEDLRFEIGSIEISGPAAAEALIGTLWPLPPQQDSQRESLCTAQIWPRLASVTDASSLPAGALLNTEVSDPRLHHPPRSKKLKETDLTEAQKGLALLLADWPLDDGQGPAALFSREARFNAGRRLPSQKAINRRKSLAPPGEYPAAIESDPKIPIMVLATRRRAGGGGTGTWTLLLPWKCVLPVWYSLMYQPLSSGGNPRLGGLEQKRQTEFESGTPWFPGDYPATQAGAAWDARETARRKEAWERRPKGKRVEYSSLDLGLDNKGELGAGWACMWQLLFPGGGATKESNSDVPLRQSSTGEAQLAMRAANGGSSSSSRAYDGHLVTVKLTLVTRGVPMTCARIYRLPQSDAKLREQWLSLLSASKTAQQHRPEMAAKAPVHERRRLLAAALLEPACMPRAGEDGYPKTPDADELLGFVTTGNFNLGEGRGTALGSLSLERILGQAQRGEGKHERLCIVRNAGQSIGRLARWELV